MTCTVVINGRPRSVDVQQSAGGFVVTIDGQRRLADVTLINGVWSLIVDDGSGRGARRSYEVAVDEQPPASGRLTLHVSGRVVSATVHTAGGRQAIGAKDSGVANTAPQQVIAPMPGKVIKLLVRRGDTVAARQGVVVVEAMKMENELRSPKAGTVADIKVSEGASVEAGAVLAVIE